jgi:DNA-binding protein Fis
MAEGDELTVDLLPEVVRTGRSRRPSRSRVPDLDTLTRAVVEQGLATAGVDGSGLHTKIVDRVERELITQVMSSCNNVQTKAAVRLGINRNTLHKKLREYGFEP